MNKILSYVVALVMITGCSTLEVSVDYDESYDFSKIKTFAVDRSFQKQQNTLFIDRAANALENELQLKNYQQTSNESADLIFIFHLNVKEKSDVQASYGLSGYRGYRYGGMMMSTTHTYEYQEGTLIVDALDPRTQKTVWRGIGVKELRDNKTPKERTQSVNNVIQKIMEKFPNFSNS